MLTNPLGLLALLGIPAIIAIHFLQRKSVELPISTLFLLDRTQTDAVSGRRFDRIVPSIPLWMQLLAVLLLTWLLVEPRYEKENTVQRLAIVLDSSASMSVFKDEAVSKLIKNLPAIQGSASSLEMIVLSATPNRPRLYTGSSIDDLTKALEKWTPRDGLTDPTQALRLARSLVSREGTVIYLTDTPADSLPFDASLLAIGSPIRNVGFTGVSFSMEQGALVWRALVKNYGTEPADRTWTLTSSAGSTRPSDIHLSPGGLATLQAAFPDNASDVRLTLSADRFPLDDILPLVKPNPKPLTLFAATSPAFADLGKKLTQSLQNTTAANDASTSDLVLATYDPLDPALPDGNAIIFVEDGTSSGSYLHGGILAESSPLMDGLNWQSLLIRETIQLDRLPSDQVLLWQEKRPLIFLRSKAATPESPAANQLFFNFDLRLSNARGQPAFIVLLHRFAEEIRNAKVAAVSENLETNQLVGITSTAGRPVIITQLSPEGKELSKSSVPELPSSIETPPDPGFVTFVQGDTQLLTASLHFADTREADFSSCATDDTLAESTTAAIDRHTRPDPLWQLWIILLVAAVLVAWKFTQRKPDPSPASPVTSGL